MEWHINDLSLDGQYPDPQAFRTELEPLLRLRQQEALLRERLFCSRIMSGRPVTFAGNFRETVQATNDRLFIRQVLGWVANSGPFWDDDRQFNEDDYFEYQGRDVTDQGLGEAARRRIANIIANVFSFQGSPFGFTNSPLQVQHGLPEAPITHMNVDNEWLVAQLGLAIQSLKTYNCWDDVFEESVNRFGELIFSPNTIEPLAPVPFNRNVMKRIFEILGVLNRLVLETDDNGGFTPSGTELHSNHFVGDKAWFTDESDNNKRAFKNEMTFHDPRDATNMIFCPFHGKIKTPQIRIHFEWLRPTGQRAIKVVYIGPKITKG